MKKIFYLFALTFAISNAGKAQQKTISLVHGSTSTFHAFLDSAMFYAANGDYIYLPGGIINFASTATSFTINKAVNIVGVGYNPDSSITLGRTLINKTPYILNTASGGSIEGIWFFGVHIYFGSTATNSNINGFLLKKCYLENDIYISNSTSDAQSSNIYILECIVSHNIYGFNNPINVIIEKCYIGGLLAANYSISSPPYWTGLTVKNNVFYHSNGFGGGNYSILAVRYSTFINNVFYTDVTNTSYMVASGVSDCTFSTNIYATDSMHSPVSFSYGSGNYYNQSINSIFQNIAIPYGFNFYNNYRLKSTCPGVNSGTDGTDIGMYGTATPFKDGGIPENPHIQFKSIGGATDQNGNLPVKIKVKAQDN